MSTVTLKGNTVEVKGQFPQAGSTAPDFTLVNAELKNISLADFVGKCKILNIFPSVDTDICATSVRRFNAEASNLQDTVVLCISADLPFAQARFCGAEGLKNVHTLSTFRNPEFKDDYGVNIATGLLAGLCARAVVVLNENNQVLHSQLVAEISSEPDYNLALAVVK